MIVISYIFGLTVSEKYSAKCHKGQKEIKIDQLCLLSLSEGKV